MQQRVFRYQNYLNSVQDIGLIFDMDGVIINNHRYHYLAWQELAAKYGVEITSDFYKNKMNGRTFMGIMEAVFERPMPVEEARAKAMEKEAIYRELYSPHMNMINGLMEFLEEARKKEIPMAVGTSAPAENVTFTLDGLNIRDFFQAVLDDQSVTKGKPDPEIYLKCASAIKRPNEKCIVFEDAMSGIQAGKAAGSTVVALATSHPKNELNADHVIDDFTQIDLNQVVAILS
jgi:beta-phosphoglucomutase family hydrolase